MNVRPWRLLTATTLTCALVAGCSPADAKSELGTQTPSPDRTSPQKVSGELESLEEDFKARIGVSAVDTGNGTNFDYRSDERFGFASTLKVFAVAELLARTTSADLDEQVTWTQADVDEAGWTPLTEKHVDTGLPLRDVAESALRVSDNAAMNIVLDEIGGPRELDAALEDAGDPTTEVIDEEPELNDVDPDSSDNTTTPKAYTADLQGLLDPDRLPEDDREVLLEWMSDNETGDPLIRAGAPKGWTVKDKSGHSDGIQNDIAVVYPPSEDPIIITVLTQSEDPDSEDGPALVAAAAEAVFDSFG
ncbi:class A beta-lactamase [Brevibacterium aurantiacum]|uniref:Beta-lactamase n=1 Tax=Brevibacterium aurantiacum TaxID=273384 RepID=A0A2A3ZKX6_BREAU|nr:class A beta-lactamase [Brevibacterium aurantiacum]MDN5545612.1 class A beta-lactamase [Rhodococcus sp. (in: high G+C Gram-positive bacteria)]PCC52133.1 class A beta-lactamase [Brevibacterium aurantiacum]